MTNPLEPRSAKWRKKKPDNWAKRHWELCWFITLTPAIVVASLTETTQGWYWGVYGIGTMVLWGNYSIGWWPWRHW